MTWVFFAAFAGQFIYGFRAAFRMQVRDFGIDDWMDFSMNFILSILAAAMFFGPLYLLIQGFKAGTSRLSIDPERAARALAGESRNQKLERLEEEAAERELHVQDLEQELLS